MDLNLLQVYLVDLGQLVPSEVAKCSYDFLNNEIHISGTLFDNISHYRRATELVDLAAIIRLMPAKSKVMFTWLSTKAWDAMYITAFYFM